MESLILEGSRKLYTYLSDLHVYHKDFILEGISTLADNVTLLQWLFSLIVCIGSGGMLGFYFTLGVSFWVVGFLYLVLPIRG